MKSKITHRDKDLELKLQGLSKESSKKIIDKIEQEYSMNAACKDWYCKGHSKTHK